MAIIKSGDGNAQLSIDVTTSAARVSLYDPSTGTAMVSFLRGTGRDLDTASGVDTRDLVAIALPGAGGAVIGGTSTAPLRTDPTGTTTQPVSGTVAVSNLPTTQPVSGSVSVTNLPTTQAVSGSVSVTNLPATQPVSGTVAVSNQPSSLQVSNFPATQQIAGSVSVSNQPTQIQVSNFPATQPISGTVTVANQPSALTVNNTTANPVPTLAQEPDIGLSYAASFDIIPTTLTTGTAYFTFRNSGSKSIFVRRFDLQQGFTGTAVASRSAFEIIRFSGTPTGGSAVAAVKKNQTSAASTSAALYAPAGLTVTGVTFDTAPFHRQASSNQLAAVSCQGVEFGDTTASMILLAPGEGFAIRASGAVVAGCFLAGSFGWRES